MSIWFSHHWHALVSALRKLTGAPITSLLNIVVIGVAFSLPTGAYILLENLQVFSGQVSGAPQLNLFLALDTDKNKIAELESRLTQHPQIASFQFIPKNVALQQLKKRDGLADIIDDLTQNPLPDAFIINVKDAVPESLESLHTEIQKWPEAGYVQFNSAWARRLDALLKLGKLAALTLAFLLGFALVATTFNTVRLQILTRRDEIEISKLIGATNDFVRRPFLYFGTIQGAIGGITAWLITAFILHLISNELTSLAKLYTVDLRLHHLSSEDSAILLLSSACLGWFGAWLSVANCLWKTESRWFKDTKYTH